MMPKFSFLTFEVARQKKSSEVETCPQLRGSSKWTWYQSGEESRRNFCSEGTSRNIRWNSGFRSLWRFRWKPGSERSEIKTIFSSPGLWIRELNYIKKLSNNRKMNRHLKVYVSYTSRMKVFSCFHSSFSHSSCSFFLASTAWIRVWANLAPARFAKLGNHCEENKDVSCGPLGATPHKLNPSGSILIWCCLKKWYKGVRLNLL